ncbi:Fructosamine kinase-domain-containing protein [Nemania abortiva]|nr:Fructosamine kinase-domain-containing protein [Nemania abortiva]
MAPGTDTAIWSQEIPVPEVSISYVDDAVKMKMPDGTEIQSIVPHAKSYWARTAKIETLDKEGKKVSYFIKVHQGDIGKKLVSGEYHSMKALWDAMPNLAVQPYGYGTYKKMEDTHFILCSFHELSKDLSSLDGLSSPDDLPDLLPSLDNFPGLVAKLHQKVSPDGTFGFPHETFGGRLAQFFPVTSSWEETFKSGVERIFESEESSQGYDEDMAQLRKGIMEKVIPRLLRPLEMGPNKIQPRLVHGDMWDGNCGIDDNTKEPVIFDATCLWAHNEYELGPWQIGRHKFRELPYIEKYTEKFAKSEPKEDFEDRILLYSVRFNLHASALYPGNMMFRDTVREDMRKLVEKFPGGYEAWVEAKLPRTGS